MEEGLIPAVRTLPSFPESITTRRLQSDQAQMVNHFVTRMRAAAFKLTQCQSAGQFITLRKELFRTYVSWAMALANVVNAEEPDANLVSDLIDDTFRDFEATICARRFSEPFQTEAVFLLSTLRRAYRLVSKIIATAVPEQCQPEDREIAREFNYWMMWSQFHLDCLLQADVHINESVLAEVLDGLRACVMAYSCARQGVGLREAAMERVDLSGAAWDEEDAQLAVTSTDEREVTLQGW
jgi:hypothetical protein